MGVTTAIAAEAVVVDGAPMALAAVDAPLAMRPAVAEETPVVVEAPVLVVIEWLKGAEEESTDEISASSAPLTVDAEVAESRSTALAPAAVEWWSPGTMSPAVVEEAPVVVVGGAAEESERRIASATVRGRWHTPRSEPRSVTSSCPRALRAQQPFDNALVHCVCGVCAALVPLPRCSARACTAGHRVSPRPPLPPRPPRAAGSSHLEDNLA